MSWGIIVSCGFAADRSAVCVLPGLRL